MAGTSLGETVMHVAQCSFDKNAYVFTKLINGKSQLFINSNGQFRQLLTSYAQIETPMSARDGRIYFSADFDGIFNIYSIDSTGGDLKRHTDAIGGYFTPYFTDGGKIIASRYGSAGFSIVEISPMSYAYTPDSSSYRCTFSSLPVPKGKVTINAHPYERTFLRSLWEFTLMGAYQTNRSLLSKQYIPDIDTSVLQIDARLQSSKSDALHKRNFGLSIDLGIFKNFTETKTTNNNSLSSNYNKTRVLDDIKYAPLEKKNNPVKPAVSDMMLRSMSTSFRKYSSSESSGDSGSSGGGLPFIPYVVPGFAVSNELGPLNVSFGANLALLMLVVPASLNTSLGVDMQICRDLYGSTNAEFSWAPDPSGGTFEYKVPISLYWARSGYINNDIGYNGADLSSVGVSIIPSGFPVTTIFNLYDYSDTITKQHNSFTAAISGSHAFQIAKYSALQLSASIQSIIYDSDFNLLDYKDKFSGFSSSDKYYAGDFGMKYHFPIVKDINKKFIHYWDALYGSIGYSMNTITNKEFMMHGKITRQALKNYSYSDSLYLDHGLHVSLTCGYYKNYLFNLNCVLDFNYYFLEKKAQFSILWGI
jgi:hypothetical protein